MAIRPNTAASQIAVFDRSLLRLRRDRAAPGIESADFLLRETAARLMERLSLVKKEFPTVLDLGSHHGVLAHLLRERAGTERVFCADASCAMAAKTNMPSVVAEEDFLPFAQGSLDAVVSNLSLHWVNDLPGALLQARHALKKDGLFLAALLGGETLHELRAALMEGEAAATCGASPRVSPFIDMRDMGVLMQRAGFALPVVDSDIITVDYSSPLKLMQDLRAMGATNATFNRPLRPTRRGVILQAAKTYHDKYADANGRVPATFQVIYAIGWAPAANQQKPLRPGSAKHRLADALGVEEIKTGDTSRP